MSDPETSDPTRHASEAQDVFLDFLVRRRGGEDIAIEDLCVRRPDLAAELTQLWQEHRRTAAGGNAEREPDGMTRELRARFGSGPAPTVVLADIESHEVDPLPQVAAANAADFPQGTRFRIDSEIARGGMGAVFKVWDKDVRRSLAMKLALKDGDDTPQADSIAKLARFVEEAQITGQLDHPGIVPVHEMGLDQDGRVFFTMRLVRGRDLRRVFELSWKNEEGWTQTRVLHLMLKVLEALAYAHNKGVIHRDLKPANVMVGRFGEAYIMDWGIARVLGAKDTRDLRIKMPVDTLSGVRTDRREQVAAGAESALVTMDGEVLGTPAYMPPEQARSENDKLSPRSDVYSVGAMLYHLLTKQTPFVPPGVRISPWQILVRVLEESPKRISEINPEAAPELVAICEKAMKREAEDRYPSAEAMHDDLEAFLENRVVTAYETGVVPELRKWVGRNRALAAALLSVAVLSVGGLGAFTYTQRANTKELEAKNKSLTAATLRADESARVAEAEEKRASHKEAVTKQMLDVFTGMFLRQDPTEARGRTITVVEVLLEESKSILKDSTLDPEVRSALEISMAHLLHNLGSIQEAADLYNDAFKVRSDWLGEADPASLEALGHLIAVTQELDRLEDAERLALHRLELLKTRHAADDLEVLEAECLLGPLYASLQRYAEAEALAQHVIAAQRAHPEYLKLPGLNAANNLTTWWSATDRKAQAIEFMKNWVMELERSVGPESPITLDAWDKLGELYGDDNKYSDAINVLERAAETRGKVEGTDSVAYLKTRAQIGRFMVYAERFAEAEPVLRSALDGLVYVYTTPSHNETDQARWDLARVLQLRGNAQESEPLWQTLRLKYEKRYGADDPKTLEALEHLVEAVRDLGRPKEALTLMQLLLERAGSKATDYEQLRLSLDLDEDQKR